MDHSPSPREALCAIRHEKQVVDHMPRHLLVKAVRDFLAERRLIGKWVRDSENAPRTGLPYLIDLLPIENYIRLILALPFKTIHPSDVDYALVVPVKDDEERKNYLKRVIFDVSDEQYAKLIKKFPKYFSSHPRHGTEDMVWRREHTPFIYEKEKDEVWGDEEKYRKWQDSLRDEFGIK